ncbi:NAD(P)-binding Rossmann-like domain protein [anaerobic digester metagenome]
MRKKAIIIGAGPAGLTAAYELLTRTEIKPVVLESSNDIGGISKTVEYKGNRIDIGGHRFFSKSDEIMKWWQDILPVEQGQKNGNDNIMLVRERLSRIYFLGKFFDYPVTLNKNTIVNLGLVRIVRIGLTYLTIKIFPPKKVVTLEDFFISRFGKELYKTFFKDYTEKVWGVPCSEIPADWGAQRVKGLSVSRAVFHAIKSIFKKEKSIEQKKTDTSLINRFLYPKYGPGQMWETVAQKIREKGGTILMNCTVNQVDCKDNNIAGIGYIDHLTGEKKSIEGDYFFSTMPVKDLITAMGPQIPEKIRTISNGLQYRDFITVGLLLTKLKLKNENNRNVLIKDNWIYIQEKTVQVGRLQIFNNWSPALVGDPDNVWIGLEYFCNEGDELWNKNNQDFIRFAISELSSINIIDPKDVIDSTIIRMPKTYPAYFGSYAEFETVRKFTDSFSNLFLIGRNGMHRYNNQDHSMLTAISAVSNIIQGIETKDNIWTINTEEDYHEEKNR